MNKESKIFVAGHNGMVVWNPTISLKEGIKLSYSDFLRRN